MTVKNRTYFEKSKFLIPISFVDLPYDVGSLQTPQLSHLIARTEVAWIPPAIMVSFLTLNIS